MHELPVTGEILKIVLRHAQKNAVQKVITVHLQIGRLSDLEDEWIQRYFDYQSKGTVAEGAKLIIERMPVILKCSSCLATYEADSEKIGENFCPECSGSESTLISGREYRIKDMEVQ